MTTPGIGQENELVQGGRTGNDESTIGRIGGSNDPRARAEERQYLSLSGGTDSKNWLDTLERSSTKLIFMTSL
jgi:hypothetical protein